MRFLAGPCSLSLENSKFSRVVKSKVVSELTGNEIESPMEQTAEATVEAAEHTLEHEECRLSSSSLRKNNGMKFGDPLPT